MASVEVSPSGGQATMAPPFDETVIEPSNPMNNNLRRYTKSVEQAKVNAMASVVTLQNAAESSKEEQGIELAFDDKSAEEEEEEECSVAAEVKIIEEALPAFKEKVPSVEAEEEAEEQDDDKFVDETVLMKPIPLTGVRSRSFQILPHIKGKDKAYPMHRSMSFDSKKGKKETKPEGDSTLTKNGGIPLFRRLSFRGKKEMKEQQQQHPQMEAPPPAAPKPPMATPPKPPRPATPLSKPTVDTATPQQSPKTMVPISETLVRRGAQDADAEAHLFLQNPPSLISTRSKESLALSEQPLISNRSKESQGQLSLQKPPSLISTRSKESLALSEQPQDETLKKNESNVSSKSTGFKCNGVIAELLHRRDQGKIQRAPTFTSEETEIAPAQEDVDGSKDVVVLAAITASKDSATSPAAAKEEKEGKEKDSTPPAASNESVEPATVVDEPPAEVTKTEEAQKVVDSALNQVMETAQGPPSVAKEDIKEDGTEATEEVVDSEVIKEEKNGLVVTSTASEVEVSAGSNFNFCERLCCGLTLSTAGSS